MGYNLTFSDEDPGVEEVPSELSYFVPATYIMKTEQLSNGAEGGTRDFSYMEIAEPGHMETKPAKMIDAKPGGHALKVETITATGA